MKLLPAVLPALPRARRAARALLAPAAVALLAACAQPMGHGPGQGSGGPGSAPAHGGAPMMPGAPGAGVAEMRHAMMQGIQRMHTMPATGDVDRDFAAMMREHHLQAVEMSRVLLRHGRSPELREMARRIIDSQTVEIAEFERWMAAQPVR